MYRVVCHNCGSDDLHDGFDEAQSRFVDHVDREHEVELERVETEQVATDAEEPPV